MINKQEGPFRGEVDLPSNRNLEAYAVTLEHLADASDDPSRSGSYREWAASMRQAIKDDGSSDQPIYVSLSDVKGAGDVWGFVRDVVEEQIGIQNQSEATDA